MFGWLKKSRKTRRSVPQGESDSMTAERELRRRFAGRRTGCRRRTVIPVQLRGGGVRLDGWTIDLSSSGALFQIDERAIPHDTDLASFSALIGEWFAERLHVAFDGGTLERRMDLVRVTVGGLGRDAVPLLACRFRIPLTPESRDLLGIGPRVRMGQRRMLVRE